MQNAKLVKKLAQVCLMDAARANQYDAFVWICKHLAVDCRQVGHYIVRCRKMSFLWFLLDHVPHFVPSLRHALLSKSIRMFVPVQHYLLKHQTLEEQMLIILSCDTQEWWTLEMCIHLLQTYGVLCEAFGHLLLEMAAHFGVPHLFAKIVKAGANPETSPLIWFRGTDCSLIVYRAIKSHNYHMLRFLEEYGLYVPECELLVGKWFRHKFLYKLVTCITCRFFCNGCCVQGCSCDDHEIETNDI
jgi:hypothetical protein